MTLCAATHPEYADTICRRPADQSHAHHRGKRPMGSGIGQWTSWANEDYVGPNARPGDFGGVLAEIQGSRPSTAPPEEAIEAWDRAGWVQDTTAAFEAWLRSRTVPFTTAEDFWPNIDAPQDHSMRAMTQPVSVALKRGWITEVDAKRLRGVYRTRDGVQFAMNKLVPVYASMISG